ncbi:MAG TPA: HigA family addiction module antitoxin [Gammaproteobacteria bacterium]|nr:HigA family addiction module antitoxin [Gammaproteobacteria bacterium]
MNINEREPFGPGDILQEEFLEPAGLTQGELAALMDVPRRRVNEIIRGRRAVSPDTAIRLSKVFKTSPEYWLNLQLRLDLWRAVHDPKLKKEYDKLSPHAA